VGGSAPAKAIQGLGTTAAQAEPSGTAAVLTDLVGQPGTPLQSYLRIMMTYGKPTPVGLLWSSRLVSVVFTPDHRLCSAFATGDSLVATLEGAGKAASSPGGPSDPTGSTTPAGSTNPPDPTTPGDATTPSETKPAASTNPTDPTKTSTATTTAGNGVVTSAGH
jgi:hypothetical protein